MPTVWHRRPCPGSLYPHAMPPTVRPRGPLPPRVYWTRRLVLLGLAVVLVAGLARLLGGSSDGSDPAGQAAQVGAGTTPSATTSTESAPVAGPTAATRGSRPGRKHRTKPVEPVLAEPSGPCESADILVTPTITTAPGGSDVPITLNLRTRVTAACTWQVSPETLTVKITSGKDDIWYSRQCPSAVPVQDVVVRQAVDTPVAVTWDARRSDEDCSDQREWALPGFYHVEAAALAGEPTDVQFELLRPSSAVITETVTPKPRPKDRRHRAGDQGGGVSEPNG